MWAAVVGLVVESIQTIMRPVIYFTTAAASCEFSEIFNHRFRIYIACVQMCFIVTVSKWIFIM